MSTAPIASAYQQDEDPDSTFQPQISPSDSDYSDEQQAVQNYQAVYGTAGAAPTHTDTPSLTSVPPYPALSMSYTTAPDFIPPLSGDQGGGGGNSTAAAPAHPIFIDLETLRSTETTFLNATQAIVEDYQTLLPLVQNAINSAIFFGQQIGTTTDKGGNKKVTTEMNTGTTFTPDSLDTEGTQFAAAVNPQMGQLLQQAGDMIEALGTFTAMMNTAGQYYTGADAGSVFPPPGLMEGPGPVSS
jgi:hypothetical protein